MKIFKKFAVLSLATSLLLVPIATNAGTENVKLNEPTEEPIEGVLEPQEIVYEYNAFNGVIAEVNFEEDYATVLVENENDEPYDKVIFSISDDVVLVSDKTREFVDKADLVEGMNLTVYSHRDTPILESYPARMGCDVVVIRENEEPTNVEIFSFDEELLSTDNVLKIFPDEDTVIVDTEGNSLGVEDIKNRDAVVFYSIATLSLPAQATPEKVIVLPEGVLNVIDKAIVNGVEVELDKPMYRTENEVLMVPLRQMAEALGFEVKWNGEENSVEVVKDAHWFLVKVGQDDYNFARSIVQLGTAPEISDSTTYVPIDFIDLIGAKVGITIDGVLEVN